MSPVAETLDLPARHYRLQLPLPRLLVPAAAHEFEAVGDFVPPVKDMRGEWCGVELAVSCRALRLVAASIAASFSSPAASKVTLENVPPMRTRPAR
jgi:hypothetical protein